MYAKLGKTKTGTLTYLLISDMYIYISPHCYDPFYCECFEQFCFCFVFGFLLSHSLVAIICVYTISLALNDGLFSLFFSLFFLSLASITFLTICTKRNMTKYIYISLRMMGLD